MSKLKNVFGNWPFWVLLIVIVFSGILSFGVWKYLSLQKAFDSLKKTSTGSNLNSTQETQRIMSMVAKHIELPANEIPTVATVNDVEKLKDQPFFANAQNGDRVLVFNTTKKAILYRESIDKVVDIAPVVFPSETPAAENVSGTPAPTPKPAALLGGPFTVTLRNTTSDTNVISTMDQQVRKTFSNLTIVNRDAVTQAVPSSLLVKGNTKATDDVIQQIASKLQLTVGPLPEGQTAPTGDFLILIGQDKVK